MASFTLKDEISYDRVSETILKEFQRDPINNIFTVNLKYLLEDYTSYEFNQDKWEYNPLMFCQDVYGNQYFFPVIIYVNGIGSFFEFNSRYLPVIVAPSKDRILKLVRRLLRGG